jgi:hypothetical protein
MACRSYSMVYGSRSIDVRNNDILKRSRGADTHTQLANIVPNNNAEFCHVFVGTGRRFEERK